MVRRQHEQRSVFEMILPDGEKLWDPTLRRIDEVLEDEALIEQVEEALRRQRPQSRRLGRPGTRLEYLLLLIVAYAVPVVSWVALGAPRYFWAPLLTLPIAVPLVRLVFAAEGRPLNRALAGTGRLHLLFGIMLAAGIAL